MLQSQELSSRGDPEPSGRPRAPVITPLPLPLSSSVLLPDPSQLHFWTLKITKLPGLDSRLFPRSQPSAKRLPRLRTSRPTELRKSDPGSSRGAGGRVFGCQGAAPEVGCSARSAGPPDSGRCLPGSAGVGLPCSAFLGAAPRPEPGGEAPRGGRRPPGPRVWPDAGERGRLREPEPASRSARPPPCGAAAARGTRARREERSGHWVPMTCFVPPGPCNCILLLLGYPSLSLFGDFCVHLRSVLFLLASCGAQGTCRESAGLEAGDLCSQPCSPRSGVWTPAPPLPVSPQVRGGAGGGTPHPID